MLGIDPQEPRRYVVEDERGLPPQEQTIFILKNLTLREMELLRNCVFASEISGLRKKKGVSRERYYLGTQERLTLEIGLIGWENFKDARGGDIPFSKENFGRVPARYRAELAVEIRQESDELSEESKKNCGWERSSIDLPDIDATDALR